MNAITRFFSRIAARVGRMFNKADVDIVSGVSVSPCISGQMQDAQGLWRYMYEGFAPWNGEKPCDGYTKNIASQHLASAVCRKVAQNVTLEFESYIVGESPRAEWINEQYQRFIENIQKEVEKLTYNGAVVLRIFPYGNKVIIKAIENDCYIPLEFDVTGQLVDVLFKEVYTDSDGVIYTLIERCRFIEDGAAGSSNNAYVVEYKAYKSANPDAQGEEIEPSSVPRWAHLVDFEVADVVAPWFILVNMPQANHVDSNSPLGTAIFSRAVSQIQKADEQAERIDWELRATEMSIDIPFDMISENDLAKGGKKSLVKNGLERLYRGYAVSPAPDVDKMSEPKYYNPQIRIKELVEAQENIRRDIENLCGLSHGELTQLQQVEKTATEINASQQNSLATAETVRRVWVNSLTLAVKVINEIGERYSIAPSGDYEDVFFAFKDNIFESEQERITQKQMLTAVTLQYSGSGIIDKINVAESINHIWGDGELWDKPLDIEALEEFYESADDGGSLDDMPLDDGMVGDGADVTDDGAVVETV